MSNVSIRDHCDITQQILTTRFYDKHYLIWQFCFKKFVKQWISCLCDKIQKITKIMDMSLSCHSGQAYHVTPTFLDSVNFLNFLHSSVGVPSPFNFWSAQFTGILGKSPAFNALSFLREYAKKSDCFLLEWYWWFRVILCSILYILSSQYIYIYIKHCSLKYFLLLRM